MGSQEPVVVNPPTQESHKATRPSAGTSVPQPVRNQTPQRRQVPQLTVPQGRSRIDSLQEVRYLLQSYRNAYRHSHVVQQRVDLALQILQWIQNNFDEQTKRNFLSFLRETYGDGKI
ncbi:MAG: hypothetical protein N3E37_02550, partial [Candidatus Micrarchaeota archaeon]|nr:hypothetical protein [Candidatus Micrarchaeota archaeon]